MTNEEERNNTATATATTATFSDDHKFNFENSKKRKVRIVMLSDTHGEHREINVPPGDIFLHCGDFTLHDESKTMIQDFNDWLGTLPHKHKVVIGGNHDNALLCDNAEQLLHNATYLQNSSVEIEGLVVHGAPQIPMRPLLDKYRANAFSEACLKKVWDSIPDNVDILMTHMPPKGILDEDGKKGCEELHKRVMEIKPKLHCFGHAHDTTGIREHNGITFANVAAANELKATVVELHY